VRFGLSVFCAVGLFLVDFVMPLLYHQLFG